MTKFHVSELLLYCLLHLSLICAQFCVPKVCYWSVMSGSHLSCIQWRASNCQGRLHIARVEPGRLFINIIGSWLV